MLVIVLRDALADTAASMAAVASNFRRVSGIRAIRAAIVSLIRDQAVPGELPVYGTITGVRRVLAKILNEQSRRPFRPRHGYGRMPRSALWL
jgi:hypothetical protein